MVSDDGFFQRDAAAIERLKAKAPENPGTGCWEWSGKSKRGPARRCWELHYGPLARGVYMLHHCDNGKCINVAHLYPGTPRQNAQDNSDRGARSWPPQRYGCSHPGCTNEVATCRRCIAQMAARTAWFATRPAGHYEALQDDARRIKQIRVDAKAATARAVAAIRAARVEHLNTASHAEERSAS